MSESVLDNPVLASLSGPHAHLARRAGRAASYAVEVCAFSALPERPGAADWDALAELLGPQEPVVLFAFEGEPPPGWRREFAFDAVQLVVGPDGLSAPEPDARPEISTLGAGDVPEMLDLVARTRPGPFLERTIEMGTYLGVRRQGRLVAMAGERMHPPGWTEISAVCTDPDARGQGLAALLLTSVATGILNRGERPLMHATETNVGALRLYAHLGFVVRRRLLIAGYVRD